MSRADLTEELRASTVRQMKSQLTPSAPPNAVPKGKRARPRNPFHSGKKERDIIIAEASRDAEIIKGQGDKEAIKIYADAFNVDRDFYSFIRSMEAYKKTMANPQTRLILSPDSAFFKHFREQLKSGFSNLKNKKESRYANENDSYCIGNQRIRPHLDVWCTNKTQQNLITPPPATEMHTGHSPGQLC